MGRRPGKSARCWFAPLSALCNHVAEVKSRLGGGGLQRCPKHRRGGLCVLRTTLIIALSHPNELPSSLTALSPVTPLPKLCGTHVMRWG